MKKKRVAWVLMLAMLCLSALAVADMPMRDRAGNDITVPEAVESIASLAPSITQVIVDLGLGGKLVAVDTYSVGIEGIPADVAVFDMMAPDAEHLVAIAPDVVLVSSMMLVDTDDPLKMVSELGICVAYIPSSDSIAGILEDTLFIGQVTGNAEGAQTLCDTLTAAVDALRVETDAPVPVYFEVGSSPALYSFGSGTFLDEMITLLGGRNIFADLQGWLSVAEESVIAADPAIIFTNEDWKEDAVKDILAREGWDGVSAVSEGKVFLIDANASAQPNHRIVEALKAMAEAFR